MQLVQDDQQTKLRPWPLSARNFGDDEKCLLQYQFEDSCARQMVYRSSPPIRQVSELSTFSLCFLDTNKSVSFVS